METTSRALCVLLVFGILIFIAGKANSQDAGVTTLCLEAEGVMAKVQPARLRYSLGEDIIINFEITNQRKKTIYLVRKSSLELFIENDYLLIEVPQPLPTNHGKFDYTFQKILPGRNLKGTFRVPGERVSAREDWRFDIGFGFVSDISGLDPAPKVIMDPAPLRGLLNSRITTFVARGLTVKVAKT